MERRAAEGVAGWREVLAAGGMMLCKEGRRKGVGRSNRRQEACLLDAEKCTPRVFAFKKTEAAKKTFGD